jgi:hypothetical protein
VPVTGQVGRAAETLESMNRLLLTLLASSILAVLACGDTEGTSPDPTQPASDPESIVPRGGEDSPSAGDQASPGRSRLTCGDGIVSRGELCDPGLGTVRCEDLSSQFAPGPAKCRLDCGGYDVDACHRAVRPADANGVKGEVVKPGDADARWADAVCNDGQPFALMVRLAEPTSAQRTRWVIGLEGGGFCDDDASPCSARSNYHTRPYSRPHGDYRSFTQTGFLRQDPATNPPFAGANHVWMHYCTSDVWTGTHSAGTHTSFDGRSPDGLTHFAGKNNVRAGLEILRQRFGLKDDPATEVLFMGTSAGAVGVLQNAHELAEQLPGAAADRRVRVLADGGWIPQWTGGWRGPGATTYDGGLAAALDFWGAQVDPVCEHDHATNAQQCYFGSTIYPYLAGRGRTRLHLPVFIQMSQLDSVFAHVGQARCDAGPAAQWRALMQAELRDVATVFSGWDVYHTLSHTTCKLAYGPTTTAAGLDGRFGPTVWRWWGGANEQVIETSPMPLPCGVSDPCD